MKYVYLLQSQAFPERRYIGITKHLQQRLREHDTGKSKHTRKYAPWTLVLALKFADDPRAGAFENYLKSGSGHAFANRHFWRKTSQT